MSGVLGHTVVKVDLGLWGCRCGTRLATSQALAQKAMVAHREVARRRPIETILQRLPTDDCVLWAGRLNQYGYGRFSQSCSAHRVVYEAVLGAIEPGLQLDHLCRNRACCNPAHLEPVTAVENIARGFVSREGYDPRETCSQGHAKRSPDERTCSVCRRAASRRYRRSKGQRSWAEKRSA